MRQSLIALAALTAVAATLAASAFGTASSPKAQAQRTLALPASVVDI
jgi:hypothetical protein